MSNKANIEDETLEKELEQGSTKKEIAYEYGYNYPSRQLDKKIKELGFTNNQKLSINEYGSANVSFKSETVSKLLEENNLQDSHIVFVKPFINNEGNLELEPTTKQFRKKQEE